MPRNDLLLLFFRSQIRKWLWNLGDHLTILLSTAAFTALFLYIFQDFIGHQLVDINATWSTQGLIMVSITISILLSILIGQWLRLALYGNDSMVPFMHRIAQPIHDIVYFRRGLVFFAILVSAGLSYFVFTFFSADYRVIGTVIAAILPLFFSLYRQDSAPRQIVSPAKISDWRRHQLIYRSMPGKSLIIAGCFGSLIGPIAADAQTHVLIVQVALLLSGLVATLGLIQAVAAELPGTWFEKQAGLSHDQWMTSWQHISNSIAVVLATSGGVAWALLPLDIRRSEWSLPFIAGFLPWLLPSLILQIEGRAKNINMMVGCLIALFFGTAMVATPWAAAALPILKTQAKAYQFGRFYRA